MAAERSSTEPVVGEYDPYAPVDLDEPRAGEHAVMLCDVGDEGHNVLVLSGIDVVLPLEMDLDGDPLMDDVVSLRSVHGRFEQELTIGHPDVRPHPDKRLVYYRFRFVPPGLYRVSVRVGSTWSSVIERLLVTHEGAFLRGQKLDATPPAIAAAAAEGVLPEVDQRDPDLGVCFEDAELGEGEWEEGMRWAEAPEALEEEVGIG
jgi:hypothetical protein